MELSVWAKLQGVSYRTAWRWFKSGVLPVPVKQLSNRIKAVTNKTKNLAEN